MVKRQQERFGWEFLSLGANIDAVGEAGKFGIRADRAVNYECDSAGTEIDYQVLSRAVSRVRASNSVATMPNALANWDEEIRRDYSQRHSNRK